MKSLPKLCKRIYAYRLCLLHSSKAILSMKAFYECNMTTNLYIIIAMQFDAESDKKKK